jgi:hypothetical protein
MRKNESFVMMNFNTEPLLHRSKKLVYNHVKVSSLLSMGARQVSNRHVFTSRGGRGRHRFVAAYAGLRRQTYAGFVKPSDILAIPGWLYRRFIS